MTQSTPKPVATLSHTNWLTNAADAQPGMKLIQARGSETITREIVAIDHGREVLATDDGWQVPMATVNNSRRLVVE